MTMPHLMNCDHSEDGWCLGCVKALWEEGQKQLDYIEQLEAMVADEMMKRNECRAEGRSVDDYDYYG